MSLKTWKKEFYPIASKSAARQGVIPALQHSLQKWIGLRQKNLEKHGVLWFYKEIYDDDEDALKIDSNSCALCHRYIVKNGNCRGCPLFEVRDEVPCDWHSPQFGNPYGTWIKDDKDPEPMIQALRRALKKAENG